MSTATSRRRFFQAGAAAAVLPAVASAADPANETLRTIAGLRTIHGNFSDKQISDAQVEAILDASVRAANASLMQSYSIVVIRDPAIQQKVCGYRGSCLLLYCADHNRVVETAKHLGHTYEPNTLEEFVTSSTNTILAAQTAVIAAKSMGIDSLLTNGIHRGDMERLWVMLDLPRQYCFPLIALVLGYAAAEPESKKGRLRGPGVIHQGKFQKLTKEQLDKLVTQYDDKSQNLTLNDGWTKDHKHYLDWYYKVWLGRNRKPGESQISKRLRAAGYGETPSA